MYCLNFIFRISLLIALVSSVFAQTEISGVINSNTTWDLTGSPYTIVGIVGITNATLTIDPGVEVRFNDNLQLKIMTGGELISEGTIEDSISFIWLDRTPWPGGIEFQSEAIPSLVVSDTIYQSGSYFSFCNFRGFGNYAPAIDSPVDLFINNCAFSSIHNDAAALNIHAKITVNRTSFKNIRTAINGGRANEPVKIFNSTFQELGSAAVRVDGQSNSMLVFDNNRVISCDYGIWYSGYIFPMDVYITLSVFDSVRYAFKNQDDGNYGNELNLYIEDSDFSNASSPAIEVAAPFGTIEITACTFNNNTSGSIKALTSRTNHNNYSVHNSEFFRCTNSSPGGAIYGGFDISSSTFIECSSLSSGGAVFGGRSIYDSFFMYDTAYGGSGGACVASQTFNSVFINNVSFGDGGALSGYTIYDNVFHNNHAIGSGGAIVTGVYQMGISRNIFSTNTADLDGAAIYMGGGSNGGQASLDSNYFSENGSLQNPEACVIYGNYEGTGNVFNESPSRYINNTGYGNTILNLENNYWGLKDPITIENQLIYDLSDDPNLSISSVEYTPFLFAPYDDNVGSPSSISSISLKTDSTYQTMLANNLDPGDTLFIELTGADSDTLSKGLVVIWVINTMTQDTVTTTIIESSKTSDLYRGVVYTAESTNNISDIIQGQDGQILKVISRMNPNQQTTVIVGNTPHPILSNFTITGEIENTHALNHIPAFVWSYHDPLGSAQASYQLQVSSDSTYSIVDMWDSYIIQSSDTSVLYNGNELIDGTPYYARIQVVTESGIPSNYSEFMFRLNSVASIPTLLSPIGNFMLTESIPLLSIQNSSDSELDNLTYDFQLATGEMFEIISDSSYNVVETQDSTFWQITVPLNDNQQYWWRARAFDGYENSSYSTAESFLLNTSNDPPFEFALITPINDAEVTSLFPLLSWEPAFDPDPLETISYVLYLDTPDPGVETFNIGTDTSYQIVTDLQDDTDYSWKIIASDLNGASTENTGGYQSFRVNTENDLPNAFDLLAPEDGSMVNDLTPTLIWEPSSDPDDAGVRRREVVPIKLADHRSSNEVQVITGYTVYLDTDPQFTETTTIEVITPNYTPELDLSENAVYYWKIEAVDDDGGVLSSEVYSFWTNSVNSSPVAFELLTPLSGSETTEYPSFSWTASEDEDLQDEIRYTLKYGPDVFSLISFNTETNTVFTPEELLSDNTEYVWQVVAEDLSGAIYASEFASFFVNSENDTPAEFTLVGPDSAGYLANADVMLVWNPSTDLEGDAIAYRILFGETQENMEAMDTVNVNYYQLHDLTDGYYIWQIEAMDGLGGTSSSPVWGFLINVNNDPPDPFNLSYPEADAVLTDQQPVFSWEGSSSGDAGDHTSYRLVFGSSIEDMGVVYEGDSTHYQPILPLLDNTVYYWQVTAIDLALATTINEGDYQSFVVNTINDAPTTAELISPDSVIVLSDTPVFNWTASTDLDPYDSLSYEVHWWTDITVMDSILTNGTQASPVVPLVDDNQQYFWNVITMDANGGIAHSEEKSFWVDFLPEPPGTFTLLGPVDESAGNSTRPELTWQESFDPDPFDQVLYKVVVATDSTMLDVVYMETVVSEDHILSADLIADTRYYWQVTALDEDSLETSSDLWTFDVGYVAIDRGLELPTEFAINQNYPNPFNPSTTIRYGLPEDSNISLVIYDVLGNNVQTLESGRRSAGWYNVVWNGQTNDGRMISTGIYFARIVAGDYNKVIKMLYLK